MTKLTVRIHDKDLGILMRMAARAQMPIERYAEELVEVQLSRLRKTEKPQRPIQNVRINA